MSNEGKGAAVIQSSEAQAVQAFVNTVNSLPGHSARLVCIDCGSGRISGPDHEGMIDCFACGAAFIPGVAQPDPTFDRGGA